MTTTTKRLDAVGRSLAFDEAVDAILDGDETDGPYEALQIVRRSSLPGEPGDVVLRIIHGLTNWK